MGNSEFKICRSGVGSVPTEFGPSDEGEASASSQAESSEAPASGGDRYAGDRRGIRIYASPGSRGASLFQTPESIYRRHGISQCVTRREAAPPVPIPLPEPFPGRAPSAEAPLVTAESESGVQTYERLMDETYGEGTSLRLRLETRARQQAETIAGQGGDRLLTYDHMEIVLKLTVGPVTLTVDPLKHRVKSVSGAKSAGLEPGALNGILSIDATTGEIKPGVGASVGMASVLIEPDGFRFSIGGIEERFDWRLNHRGGSLKPSVALGPLVFTAEDPETASIGAVAKIEAGIIKAEATTKLYFKVDGELANRRIRYGVDRLLCEPVNGKGCLEPLREALEPRP